PAVPSLPLRKPGRQEGAFGSLREGSWSTATGPDWSTPVVAVQPKPSGLGWPIPAERDGLAMLDERRRPNPRLQAVDGRCRHQEECPQIISAPGEVADRLG